MTAPLDDPRLAYHRSQAIRDPHNAAYHEARADLLEARAENERLTKERDASPAYLAWARERDRMRADLAASRAEVERLRQEWDEACGLLASEAATVGRLTKAIQAAASMLEGGQNWAALDRLRTECGPQFPQVG